MSPTLVLPQVPAPTPRIPTPLAPYRACASFDSHTCEPHSGPHRPSDTPLGCREGWGWGWAQGNPRYQRVLTQSQGPETQNCSLPKVEVGSLAVRGIEENVRHVESLGQVWGGGAG